MIDLSIGPDGIAELRFDTPGEKVNILTEASLARLSGLLGELERAAAAGTVKGAALTSGKKGVFLAGADVKAFVTVAAAGDPAAASAKAAEGQRIFSRLAALPIPTVAGINGACLGGGLELALACVSRIASDAREVSIGLPEVRLGLIPGWGGTQRLPRLIGPGRALDLILTGRTLDGRRARKLGVVDAVVPAEGIALAARREAARLAAGGRVRRAPWDRLDRLAPLRPLVFAAARRRVLAQTAGRYPAPRAALEAVSYGLGRPLEEGLRREAELIGPLLVGDVSRHLVQIFLSSRAAASAGAAAADVRRLGVLGAGTMGGGIAAVAAMGGLSVRLKDVSAEALARGMRQVRALSSAAARRGRMPRHEADRREALVAPATDMTGFASCDLVVEAVVEDLEVKRRVLAEVERATPPACVFATNTSSLSVAAIAEGAARPGRVVGLHFFNPVEKMPLVEIVRGPATEDAAVEAALAVARRMGKTPVVVRDTPGFIVNRILMPYLGGAVELLAGGADPVAVDRAMTSFGMPMGPFALLDQIGLDVAAHVAGVLAAAFPDRGGETGLKLLHGMAQAGLLGMKAGKGFYRYPSRKPSPELKALVAAAGGRTDGAGGAPEPAAVADRLVGVMVQEAARLLEEGSVDRPETIDLAMVMGAGFPPWRGGLLRHADARGGREGSHVRRRFYG
ncbi:MAG TPA: 3-hydroxyacyl-CoA dehydrogenase NAD-binding domain-containing protein [Candidatus Polarisedimenticolia bacterium]|nr:3-hydroxyacyl-CoA dehydrogenase NAD-binding domain-containing protein [Candidatus Polarisedimenticolia bacterium]